MLGGPGSGKTWLAKRTVRRCAEDALEALAAGETLDEIELPLYITCSHLVGADGDIRHAIVSSALDQLGDLGGSRLSAALRAFFTERNAPTVLVIDALDEAHDSDERLRQAGTLPWRIVLTSRPSSWNHQLIIEKGNDSQLVGELQPLRYPDDVEPYVHHWFSEIPERGNGLAAQLARRPDLQQAATVPLILAFYCIVSGTDPLPDFRRDLYSRVLKRMLTGRWRGSHHRQLDVGACLWTLRNWAWSGAVSNAVSGVGKWVDDIDTEPSPVTETDQDALDHVASPLGPPDVDSGKTLRRFTHRSIREHLVAEHIADLPIDQAAETLLPHLWYDPDWEYSAPAALAMHPLHDQLLRDLICRAACSDQIPRDLSVIDAAWEFRGFLARVAVESGEADWSPELAEMIGRARVELARSGRLCDLGGAPLWGASNRQAREVLLGLLTRQADGQTAAQLATGLAQLAGTEEEKHQAREMLLGLLTRQTDGQTTAQLATGLAQLAGTEEEKHQAREMLLGLLTRQTDGRTAARLATGLVHLDPTNEEKRRAREVLLGLLVGETRDWAAAQLATSLVQLAETEEEKHQTREVLLRLLTGQTDGWAAAELTTGLVQLAETEEEKHQTREVLFRLLTGQTDGWAAAELTTGLVHLDPSEQEKHEAREVVLGLLARQTEGWAIARLAAGLVRLAVTAEDKREARDILLTVLTMPTDGLAGAEVTDYLVHLATTAEDKRKARERLLGASSIGIVSWAAGRAADSLAHLDPTAGEKRQARDALLGLLARETSSKAGLLVGGLVQLGPTAEDKRRARDVLLGLLARETSGALAAQIVGGLAHLDPTVGDLSSWRDWAALPTVELLATVRRNSTLADWLKALPLLTTLSR